MKALQELRQRKEKRQSYSLKIGGWVLVLKREQRISQADYVPVINDRRVQSEVNTICTDDVMQKAAELRQRKAQRQAAKLTV